MANLYHRRLLTDLDASAIAHELEYAITYLQREKGNMEQHLADALTHRLKLRVELLSALQIDHSVNSHKSHCWERCLQILPKIGESTKFGLPVESAFSAKIQRRLASSVPPRPMIQFEFSIIDEYLTRLCQHGKDVYRVLDCQGVSDLTVRTSSCLCCTLAHVAWRHPCGHSNREYLNHQYISGRCCNRLFSAR